jgi:hypothetical protein
MLRCRLHFRCRLRLKIIIDHSKGFALTFQNNRSVISEIISIEEMKQESEEEAATPSDGKEGFLAFVVVLLLAIIWMLTNFLTFVGVVVILVILRIGNTIHSSGTTSNDPVNPKGRSKDRSECYL